MPKAITKNTVFAKNEPLGLRERIDISKETREKYKDVCKRRPVPKPRNIKVVTHPPSPGHLERYIDDMIAKTVSHHLLVRTRTLAERLANPPPPLLTRITDNRPLAERIGDHIDEMKEKYPEIDHSLSFKKKFRERRIKEHTSMLNPTIDRLLPVFKYLDTAEAYDKIAKEDIDSAWVWFSQLQDLSIHFETVGHQWKTNKPWRDLKGLCKRVRNVNMKDFNRRKTEIAREVIKLDLTVPPFTLPTN